MENEVVEKMMVNFLKKLMDTMTVMQHKVYPDSAMNDVLRPRMAPCPIDKYGTVAPQCYFKPRKLYIPEHIAKQININNITVGKNSQTLAAGSIPGEMFMAPTEMVSLLLSESERVGFLKAAIVEDRQKFERSMESLSNLVELFEALGPVPAAIDVCQPGVVLQVHYSMKSVEKEKIPFAGVFVGEAVFG